MQTLLTIIHIVASIFLCLVILLQSGRGGGMGAAMGGASSQIFGGRGAGNFLSRLTSIAAVVFFFTSLTLSMMSSRQHSVVAGAHKTDVPVEAPAATPVDAAKPADATKPADAAPAPAPEGAKPADAPAAPTK
jgi:preprotein translocase subunit SecG